MLSWPSVVLPLYFSTNNNYRLSCPAATEFPIFLFSFLSLCAQFLRWWWWWCRRQQRNKPKNLSFFYLLPRCCTFKFIVTNANSRLGFSISLSPRAGKSWFFSFILCRKPAQLLSRDFHRQCDVVVVCPFTDRATDIRRASIKNKKNKTKNSSIFDFCFCRFPHPDGHGDLNFSIWNKTILFGLFFEFWIVLCVVFPVGCCARDMCRPGCCGGYDPDFGTARKGPPSGPRSYWLGTDGWWGWNWTVAAATDDGQGIGSIRRRRRRRCLATGDVVGTHYISRAWCIGWRAYSYMMMIRLPWFQFPIRLMADGVVQIFWVSSSISSPFSVSFLFSFPGSFRFRRLTRLFHQLWTCPGIFFDVCNFACLYDHIAAPLAPWPAPSRRVMVKEKTRQKIRSNFFLHFGMKREREREETKGSYRVGLAFFFFFSLEHFLKTSKTLVSPGVEIERKTFRFLVGDFPSHHTAPEWCGRISLSLSLSLLARRRRS